MLSSNKKPRFEAPPLGAFDRVTNDYILLAKAEKNRMYECPSCAKDVFVKEGTVRSKHFCHARRQGVPCHHYDHPGESEIHQEAKRLMKYILENQWKVTMSRNCICCSGTLHEIPSFTPPSSSVVLEYAFEIKGRRKVADVAFLEDGERLVVFEICHTHRTCEEDRDGEWFEINASKLIQQCNDETTCAKQEIEIQCLRVTGKCNNCILSEKSRRIASLYHAISSCHIQKGYDIFIPRTNRNKAAYYKAIRWLLIDDISFECKKHILKVSCENDSTGRYKKYTINGKMYDSGASNVGWIPAESDSWFKQFYDNWIF